MRSNAVIGVKDQRVTTYFWGAVLRLIWGMLTLGSLAFGCSDNKRLLAGQTHPSTSVKTVASTGSSATIAERIPPWMKSATLEGNVIKEQQHIPLSGAQLSLAFFLGSKRVDAGVLYAGNNGDYHFNQLAPGAYAITCQKSGYATEIFTFWVDRGLNRAPTCVLGPASSLMGQVIDDQNQPVAGAQITIDPHFAKHRIDGSSVTVSDKNGYFIASDLRRGNYQVRAKAPGYLSTVEPMIEVPQRDLQIRLIRMYSVKGIVKVDPTWSSSPALNQLKVKIRLVGSGLWPGRVVEAQADDGSFLFEQVPWGIYEMVAYSTAEPWAASVTLSGLKIDAAPNSPVIMLLKPAQKISGVVVHGNRPVAGASVSLSPGSLTVLQNKATSDKKGHFTFDPVLPGDYRLGVWAKGFLPVSNQALIVPAPLPLKIEVNTGLALDGRVTDRQGNPISQALVYVQYRLPPAGSETIPRSQGRTGELGIIPGPVPPIPLSYWSAIDEFASLSSSSPHLSAGNSITSTTSNSSGVFHLTGLAPGEVQVIAQHAGFCRTRSAWLKLNNDHDLSEKQPPEQPSPEKQAINTLHLVLRPATLLQGKVLDERGMGLGGVEVTAQLGDESRATTTDPRGEYVIEGLWGAAQVSAYRGGYLPASQTIKLSPNASRHYLDLVLAPAHGSISGYVLDSHRLPINNARVVIQLGHRQLKTKTDQTGFFELAGVGRKPVRIQAIHPQFQPAEGVFAPNHTVELYLRFTASIAGRVQDYRTNAAVQKFSLLVTAPAFRKRFAFRDPHGRFELKGLPSGHLSITAEANGYAIASKEVMLPEPSGQSHDRAEVNFVLQQAGIVEGVTYLAATGEPMINQMIQVAGLQLTTGKNGEFRITAVPEGQHIFEAKLNNGNMLHSDSITVRANETTGPVRLFFK